MKKDYKTCKVSRIEYHDNMLDIRAVLLDILAEVLGDLAQALMDPRVRDRMS